MNQQNDCINLKWYYYRHNNNVSSYKPYITEKIDSNSNYSDSIFGFIVDLEIIFQIKNNGSFLKKEAKDLAEKIWNSLGIKYNKNLSYLDLLDFIAEDIKYSSISVVKDYESKYLSKETFDLMKSNLEQFSKDISLALYYYQHEKVDDSINQIESFIEKIKSESEKSNETKTLRDLLKKYVDAINKSSRCFAAYFFETEKKTMVAFSGYFDTLEYFIDSKKLSLCRQFCNVIQKICDDMEFEWIKTNDDISLFDFDSKKFVKTKTMIEEYNKYGQCDEGKDEIKRNFSCAERKIFSKFEKEDGILFSRLPYCCRCCRGINYYTQEGVSIKHNDSLWNKKSVNDYAACVCLGNKAYAKYK